MYRDANHKPEMALALSDFTALCGFVETGELTAALEATPELRGLVGEAMASLVASTGDGALRCRATASAPLPCPVAIESFSDLSNHLLQRLAQSCAGRAAHSAGENLAKLTLMGLSAMRECLPLHSSHHNLIITAAGKQR